MRREAIVEAFCKISNSKVQFFHKIETLVTHLNRGVN